MHGRGFRCVATGALIAAVASFMSACASTPEAPPNAPPPLLPAERVGVPGVPHSDVIEAAGDPVMGPATVERGGSIIRIPFRYRHTAVLTQDVVGYSITVSGVQAPAGSPGYYAGTFSGGVSPAGPRGPKDMWCFLPSVAGGEREHLCLLRNVAGVAAIAPTRMNPYLWTQFAPATGTFDYVRTPIFERRPIEIPGDLTLEYRFGGWSDNAARVTEYAAGREVREFTLPRNADGTATLRTIAGTIAIAPASTERNQAAITLTAP